MKSYLALKCFAVVFILIGSTSINAQEIDFSGKWNGEWEFSDKSYKERITLNLKQNDKSITGNGIDQLGVKASISGSVKANGISIIVKPENNSEPILFKGNLKNRTIKGKWYINDLSGPWFVTK